MLQSLLIMDQSGLLWIQTYLRHDMLSPWMVFITTLGNNGMIWLLLSFGLLIPKKTRKIGMMSLIALGFAFIIDNVLLKNIVARTRPYEVLQSLTPLIEAQKDYSFPSGHTGSSFASAVVLFCGLPKRYGIPAVVLAALIGFSRLYVGVHYPTDVLCGALIGTGIALLIYMIGANLPGHREIYNYFT